MIAFRGQVSLLELVLVPLVTVVVFQEVRGEIEVVLEDDLVGPNVNRVHGPAEVLLILEHLVVL